jgi:hypothetical protein
MYKALTAVAACLPGTQRACAPQLPPGTRRAVVLSGMSGSEVQEVISAYADSGMRWCCLHIHLPHTPTTGGQCELAALLQACLRRCGQQRCPRTISGGSASCWRTYMATTATWCFCNALPSPSSVGPCFCPDRRKACALQMEREREAAALRRTGPSHTS